MKNLMNLGTILNKKEQKSINGGRLRCSPLYFGGPGNSCAVPNGVGGALFGTLQNGLCCV